MAKKLRIYQIDSFTNRAFSGNPAAVTFGNSLSNDEMQTIAKEMNLSETAFVSESEKANYKLQWFTPTTEVELCGHGTVAALHFLKENKARFKRYPNGTEHIRFETLSGIIKCYIDGTTYFMQIPVPELHEYEPDKKLLSALGVNKKMTDDKYPAIHLSDNNIYIYLKKLTDLQSISPDFKALKKFLAENNLGGVVLFTRETIDKDNFAHSRYFTPGHGINEDPVTGSTNGPLLLVLKKLNFIKDSDKQITYTFEQGDHLGRSGRIGVNYYPDKDELYIHGSAVTVLKGELIF